MRRTTPCWCVAVMLVARVAGAQPSANDARATELFDRGTQLYERSSWAEAEVAFQASWELRRAFDTAANLGDCELHVGQMREAAEHLAYALKNRPVTIQPKAETRLRARFEEARRQVGELVVRVGEAGAAVSVDARVVGVAPLVDRVFVDPGPHTVSAELRGTQSAREVVSVGAGDKRDVTLTLTPTAVGGTRTRPLWPAVVGGAAALAFVGAGIGMFAVASGKASDADQAAATVRGVCSPTPSAGSEQACATNASARSSHDTFQSLGVASFVVGGAFAAGATAYLLWPRGAAAPATGLRAMPIVGFGSGGLVVEGKF